MFFRGKDEHIFAVCVINLAFFWIAAPRGGKAREVAWTPICFVLDGIWDFYNHFHTLCFWWLTLFFMLLRLECSLKP
jgi:hypothetical protein